MYEILSTEKFAIFFSFIIGAAIVALTTPICKGTECYIMKAPPLNEIKTSTYRLGSKCFQFKGEPVDCPANGVIEAFMLRK